jgi:hypothetical protein
VSQDTKYESQYSSQYESQNKSQYQSQECDKSKIIVDKKGENDTLWVGQKYCVFGPFQREVSVPLQPGRAIFSFAKGGKFILQRNTVHMTWAIVFLTNQWRAVVYFLKRFLSPAYINGNKSTSLAVFLGVFTHIGVSSQSSKYRVQRALRQTNPIS